MSVEVESLAVVPELLVVTVEALASHASGVAQTDLAHVFQCVFAVAAGWIGLGLLLLTVMEERPLRGRARPKPVPAE